MWLWAGGLVTVPVSPGRPLSCSFPCRVCREEHQPARDPPQHQHRGHQHQSAQPVTVHVSSPCWGAACSAQLGSPAPPGALPMWHTGASGGRGQGAVTGLRERGGGVPPAGPGLSSTLWSPSPRRVPFLPLPPCGHAASPRCGEELTPASPGILGIPVVKVCLSCRLCQVVSSVLPALAVPCPGPAGCDGPQLGGDHSWGVLCALGTV